MPKPGFSQLSIAVVSATAFVVATTTLFGQNSRDIEAKVDQVFAKWTTSTPGCAVGVATAGEVTRVKAYGMADLEHDIKNTPDTIFEAGSVSKQFTAAAVLLLAREGKLSLDDPARKYVPELPEYGVPVTIRQMLTHTSGLRDWGNVAAIGGWPRGNRVHTHAHVLDIVSRQGGLNFTPGTRWSYSNTGYNLAAIIVSRVSGTSFSEFTRQRIFAPLGMTHTSWRDDHSRIIKGRAIAYSEERDGFHIEMPFENVHGNGGLLTTVGDLLKWNENFVSPTVGDAAFVNQQEQVGRFSDGRSHEYAFGFYIRNYKGVREVSHGGATAGYRAYLSRYPDQQLSVAVLCNASSATAPQYANAVAELYLADRLAPLAPPAPKHSLTSAEIGAAVGLYRNKQTGMPLNVGVDKEGLQVGNGIRLVAISPSRFVTALGQTWEMDGQGAAHVTDQFGTVDTYERVTSAKPTVEQLQDFVGTYTSDEAETTMTVAIDGDTLVLKQRPDRTLRLTPIYSDVFSGQLGTLIFRRNNGGRATEFSVMQDRVWDLRFTRQAEAAKSSSQH